MATLVMNSNDGISNENGFKMRYLVAFFALVLLLISNGCPLYSSTDRRVLLGLAVFPRILALDTALDEGLSEPIRIAFVYSGLKRNAEEYRAAFLTKVKSLRGREVTVTLIHVDEIENKGAVLRPQGVFVVDEIGEVNIQKMVDWTRKTHTVTFSPFRGDVERGMLCGIYIGARVQPFINADTLRRSGIQFNPNLLKVAKIHE